MALIHQATLTPTKRELVRAWLPTRPWFAGGDFEQLGAYRFDDPAGEVGVETFLLATTAGQVLHLPFTYRAAPLAGADAHLVGTTDHSVLGTRWVYDGCADPVWARTVAAAILTGGTNAAEEYPADSGLAPRTPSASARGSGSPGTPVPAIETVSYVDGDTATVQAGPLDLTLARVADTAITAPYTLTVTWSDTTTAILAGATPR
jgi:Maltokinase N-terminal cap domain